MNNLMVGATAMASAMAGLFFLRFWFKTHDRLFLLFAIAFWMMTANWLGVAAFRQDEVNVAILYIIRLAAFLLILFSIVEKNRSRANDSSKPS